jgi:hypothetical protein
MICLSKIVTEAIKVRTIRWSGMWHAWRGREINANFFVGNAQGKIQTGKMMRMWEDNIKNN